MEIFNTMKTMIVAALGLYGAYKGIFGGMAIADSLEEQDASQRRKGIFGIASAAICAVLAVSAGTMLKSPPTNSFTDSLIAMKTLIIWGLGLYGAYNGIFGGLNMADSLESDDGHMRRKGIMGIARAGILAALAIAAQTMIPNTFG